MCSSVFGPAMPPPLVTCPTSSTAGPDSSPETYSVTTPWLSSRAAHCMRSVDLPMPGSPPTRTTDPGTIPPPRTKSNSARPVCQRATASLFRSVRRIGGLAVGRLLTAEPLNRPTGSSINEFQAPHESHLPPHLGWSAPHSVLRKTEWSLDTTGLEGGRLARRVVVEARVFLLEVQLHGAGGAIALFADDHLRDALDALVRLGIDRAVVELLSIDEADDVRVLLDGPGLAQVGELWPAVLASPLLGRARKLRDRDDGHVELLGERLEGAGDVGDLLLPVLDVAGPLHQLQVVHDYERNVVLGLQPACLRAHRQRRERRGVVNPDRRRPQQSRGTRELRVIVVAELAAPQPLRIDQSLRAEQPLHELILRHLQRKERHPGVVLDRGVLHNVQCQRGLSHGWTRRDDDEIGALEASRVAIQIDESAWHPSQRTGAGLELLDPLHRRPDELLDPNELLGAPELRHLKDTVLRIVEHFAGGPVSLVDVLDDAGGRLDEPAQHRLVAHDPGVIVDVGGGGDDVDERRDVFHPPGAVQVAAARQLVAQRHGIDDIAALGQRQHRAEQEAMRFPVEHRVVQDFSGFERRVLVEQHGAEDRLLGFVAPGSLAAGKFPPAAPRAAFSRRGGERRYGRHPRLVSSNEGYAARQPGDRSPRPGCRGNDGSDCGAILTTVWC